ncbi:MAG: PRC-barrel domain-containing protein [Hyphomicrobiaceae bacterium]|nr:PRC-barrel domain-containing protein [Hyphomicrobiaceae bacterium]
MSRLIGTDKVEGTRVFTHDGNQVGEIIRLVVDKPTGVVAYAVMSAGGFMGLKSDHLAIPWAALAYDQAVDGYRARVPDAKILSAPEVDVDHLDDATLEKRIHNHYAVPFYWKASSPISL